MAPLLARLGASLVAVLVASAPGSGRAQEWEVDTGASTLRILVSKKGVLSGLVHGHRFEPERWSATASFSLEVPGAVRVEAVVDAASLHDHEQRLNAGSRAEVDRTTAGPAVLDAARFPVIRFDGREVTDRTTVAAGVVELTLRGTLSLHGVEGPVDVRLRVSREGARVRAVGSATFLQSSFGMKPYSTALGTIGVDDPVRLELDLVLRPAGAGGA